MHLLFLHKFHCALSVPSGPISSPLTLLSSGPPDQRKQIRRWQSCHGNGSSWWHPASPPQWWKWYSLAHSGQAVAGTPYMGEQESGEEDGERERERESGLRSSLNCLCGPTSHPPLSATSPSLHLSSSPLFPLSSSLCLRSACRGIEGGTCEWVGWDGALLWQWRRLAGGSSGGCWRCSWWGEIACIQNRCQVCSQMVGKSLVSCCRKMPASWSDKRWTQENKLWKNPTWN